MRALASLFCPAATDTRSTSLPLRACRLLRRFSHRPSRPLPTARSPEVEVASYTQDNPNAPDVVIRCQTTGAVTARAAAAEALGVAKAMLGEVSAAMDAAVADFERRQRGGGGGGAAGR